MRSSAKRLAAVPVSQPVPTYAKLTRPRMHAATARTRLFALLDALRERHRVIWVAAPPGGGKSTLAATWLAHTRAPAIWYQIDPADSDPATLFFYLGEALRAMDAAIPWTAPACAGDSASFARLYFRTLFAALPAGAVLVLDNLHEFDWTHAAALLDCAFSEVPDGVTVLALSREAPPDRLARMELGGTLALLGWDALRADHAEALAIAHGGDADAWAPRVAVTGQWLALADGWPAALAMLRAADSDAALITGRESAFRYLAGEVLDRMAPSDQHALLLVSCVPALSAEEAQALTGEAATARLLERLYRDRLFVERRAGLTYHFHPLFGAFLRQRAAQQIAGSVIGAHLARAAAMLEAAGRTEEAASVYQQAGDHAALAGFVRRSAAAMIGQGRGETWRHWLSWIDTSVADTLPELGYWHGLSLLAVRPQYARGLLTRAHSSLSDEAHAPMRSLAAAAIVDSYDAEWSDTSGLQYWAGELREGLRERGVLPAADPVTELVLQSRLVAALLATSSDAAALAQCAERAASLMQQVGEGTALLSAGAILLRYYDRIDSPARANGLITQLSQVEAPAPAMVAWYRQVARWFNKEGDLQHAQQVMMAARSLAGAQGLDPAWQVLEARHLLETGDMPGTRTLLDRTAAVMPEGGRELVEWSLLDAQWHARCGDLARALDAARLTVRFGHEAGMPAAERAGVDAFLGNCLAWAGDFDSALRCHASAHAAASGVQLALLQGESLFISACALAHDGELDAACRAMQQAMDLHRQRRSTALFPMVPRLAASVLALALEYRIEAGHAAAIAARQQLTAPHRCAPGWPWPVAVRTLGKLEIALDGVPLAPSGKTQQRPLTLLKSLVAAGEGGRTQQALVTQLWGNAEVARSALNVTLHRLRKILCSDDVVLVSGGRMVLNEARVWSDVAALDSLCAEIAALPGAPATAVVGRLAAALLDLYRGPFCDGIDDSWILPLRDRTRNAFLGAVARLGGELEADGQWPLALSLYQRALEAEPLSEANYRGWMRCAHAQDGVAAAFGAYRRCRDTLSIVLGVAPAQETEKLAVALGLK